MICEYFPYFFFLITNNKSAKKQQRKTIKNYKHTWTYFLVTQSIHTTFSCSSASLRHPHRAQSPASASTLIVCEQNNSPGFGNGLPLILIRETLNKIYPQILQCDLDSWGWNDPGAERTVCVDTYEHLYTTQPCGCKRSGGWWTVLDQYRTHPHNSFTLSCCLSLSGCRSLDSSCLSFAICSWLYFYLSVFFHFFFKANLSPSFFLALYSSLALLSSVNHSHAWLVFGLIWKQDISLLLMGHRGLITTCHH